MSIAAIENDVFAINQDIQSTNSQTGFLSTLASYLTSKPKKTKSEPKKVIQKRKLINKWDEFDMIKLNYVLCNYLYHDCSQQKLLAEIEKLAGKPREVCLYTVFAAFSCMLLLHDPVGTITGLMTLVIPAFYTALSLTQAEDKDGQKEFVMRYWLIYSVFVTVEAFFSTLIKFDLRLIRLLFLSTCLTAKVPVMSLTYNQIYLKFCSVKKIFEDNNWHLVETDEKEVQKRK